MHPGKRVLGAITLLACCGLPVAGCMRGGDPFRAWMEPGGPLPEAPTTARPGTPAEARFAQALLAGPFATRAGLIPEDKEYLSIEVHPWSPVLGDRHDLEDGQGATVATGLGSYLGEKEVYFGFTFHEDDVTRIDWAWLRLGLRLKAALYSQGSWNLHYKAGLEFHLLLPDQGNDRSGMGLVLGGGVQGMVERVIWSAGVSAHPFWLWEDSDLGVLLTAEVGVGYIF